MPKKKGLRGELGFEGKKDFDSGFYQGGADFFVNLVFAGLGSFLRISKVNMRQFSAGQRAVLLFEL